MRRASFLPSRLGRSTRNIETTDGKTSRFKKMNSSSSNGENAENKKKQPIESSKSSKKKLSSDSRSSSSKKKVESSPSGRRFLRKSFLSRQPQPQSYQERDSRNNKLPQLEEVNTHVDSVVKQTVSTTKNVSSNISTNISGRLRLLKKKKTVTTEEPVNSSSVASYAEMNIGIGNSHVATGNYDLAKDSYEAALRSTATCRTPEVIIQEARAMHAMSIIALFSGFADPSVVWIKESLELVQSIEMKECLDLALIQDMAEVLEDMGIIFFIGQRDDVQARNFFLEAVRIREILVENASGVKTTSAHLCSVARLNYMIELVMQRKVSNDEYMTLLQENRTPTSVGVLCPTLLAMLIYVGSSKGNASDALPYYEQAFKLSSIAKISREHPIVHEISQHIYEVKGELPLLRWDEDNSRRARRNSV